MNNSHEDIKRLLKASREMLSTNKTLNETNQIREKYKLIVEQDGVNLTSSDNITKKINVAKSIEDRIDYDTEEYETANDSKDLDGEEESSGKDLSQGYRISGGILVLHGKDRGDLELTTDEKIAFQETMDEFVNSVSNMVDFNKLNVYPNNVEWSGKIIDFDVEYFFSIGEENGLYINANMMKTDDKFLELLNKLKIYYDKFKSKWAQVLSSRKRTNSSQENENN